MSNPLEQARAEVARLERQQVLEDALHAAARAHAANSTQDNLAAHDAAAVALAEHRAAYRASRGPQVGGDAVQHDAGEGE